jgi:dienelactone hydrolase
MVVGIDHPYGSNLTIFPDGREARTTLNEFLAFSTDAALDKTLKNAEAQLNIRAADVCFVLDELQRLDRFDPLGLLTGRIDFARIGIFGHSFGGAVAAEVCRIDPRVKAGINLDGTLVGEPTRKVVGKPFLLIADSPAPRSPSPSSPGQADSPAEREASFAVENEQCILRALSANGGYWMYIRGTRHMNFCDSPLYSPLRFLTHAGSVRPERAMEIINAHVVSFFQTYLNGMDGSLLDTPAPGYPEVEIERVHKDQM